MNSLENEAAFLMTSLVLTSIYATVAGLWRLIWFWLKSNTDTYTRIRINTQAHTVLPLSCTSHTCTLPHSVINRQTVPIRGLDESQLCSSSVVKLLTPTGRETKRGEDQAAQQRGALERRKEEVNRDKLDIRGTVEVSCVGAEGV